VRLRAGYIAAAVLLGGAALAAYMFVALAAGQRAYSFNARERASLLADLLHQSFLALNHGPGGSEDVEQFLSYLRESRAGGIESIKLLDPDGSTRVLLSGGSKGLSTGRTDDGMPATLVTLPILNRNECRSCHLEGGDVLALLSVSVLADGPAYKFSTLRSDLFWKGLFLGFLLMGLLGLSALIFRARPPSSGPEERPGAPDAPYTGEGFGSIFAWMSASGKRPDISSMQSMQKVEKMATIGELASAMAHEIKNPLAGISGAIQVLSESMPDDDRRRDVFDEVLTEIQRLDKTVKDLLEYARPPEAGFIWTPLSSITEHTVRLMAGQAKKQGVDVNIIASKDLAVVRADPDQLQQVLLNMLMNSLHSMPGGGTITLATRVIEEDGVAEVTLTDTGAGIAKEDAQRIFEPFFTTSSTGTGLGLAICREVVERHGGSIELLPPSGAGASFRIRLPLDKEIRDA
jgi:signal transduction histidine kinase